MPRAARPAASATSKAGTSSPKHGPGGGARPGRGGGGLGAGAGQAAQDRKSFALREVLGGIETYKNPFDSHAVELPANFGHQWVNRGGTIFLTTNAMDDPRVGSTEEWVRMERYRP